MEKDIGNEIVFAEEELEQIEAQIEPLQRCKDALEEKIEGLKKQF